LHGSVDDGEIVPPTWNKTLASKRIQQAWQLAHWLLSEANHVRVLGYSLPEGDNYIKYLFQVSAIKSSHLKSFDVLCLDPDGAVRARYDRFLTYQK
jgi:hypothetical protein